MTVVVPGGGTRFHAVARKLRGAANRKDLVKEMRKGILAATPALKDAVRARAGEFLPDRYAAELVPAMRITTVTNVTGDQVTVKLTVTAKGRQKAREIGTVNDGLLRHPGWGRRKHWYAQPVKPGVVTEPMADKKPEVRRQIEAAVDRVLTKITEG